jgi:hypothetical protein
MILNKYSIYQLWGIDLEVSNRGFDIIKSRVDNTLTMYIINDRLLHEIIRHVYDFKLLI